MTELSNGPTQTTSAGQPYLLSNRALQSARGCWVNPKIGQWDAGEGRLVKQPRSANMEDGDRVTIL